MHRQLNRQFEATLPYINWAMETISSDYLFCPSPPTRHTHKYILKGSQKHMGNVVQQKLATGPLSFQWLTLISPIFPSEMLGVTARLSRVLQILRLFGAWHGMVCPQDIIPFVPSWVLDISHVTPWNHLQNPAFFGSDINLVPSEWPRINPRQSNFLHHQFLLNLKLVFFHSYLHSSSCFFKCLTLIFYQDLKISSCKTLCPPTAWFCRI